jgi:hypothetical protein
MISKKQDRLLIKLNLKLEMQSNTFIFVWDCYGLECCLNLTELEHNNLIHILKNEKSNINVILNSILLRARFNPQRHYEIYTCEVQEGIDQNDLKNMFDSNPQKAANLIRNLGSKIYSDRFEQEKVLIT